jgi:hypothetical protein
MCPVCVPLFDFGQIWRLSDFDAASRKSTPIQTQSMSIRNDPFSEGGEWNVEFHEAQRPHAHMILHPAWDLLTGNLIFLGHQNEPTCIVRGRIKELKRQYEIELNFTSHPTRSSFNKSVHWEVHCALATGGHLIGTWSSSDGKGGRFSATSSAMSPVEKKMAIEDVFVTTAVQAIPYRGTDSVVSRAPQIKKPSRKHVFISYSHADTSFLNELMLHLKPIEKQGLIEAWSDQRIQSGDDWKREITEALERSQFAILLISAAFHASDFIIDNELPPLLLRAKKNGVRFFPIILSASRFTRDPLGKFQAVNDPKLPLASLQFWEREDVYERVAREIEQAAAILDSPRVAAETVLPRKPDRTLSIKIDERDPFIGKSPSGADSLYYHLVVNNLHPSSPVIDCKVSLTRFWRTDGGKHFIEHPIPGPAVFCWAPRKDSPELLSFHDNGWLDFGFIHQGSDAWKPQIRSNPQGFDANLNAHHMAIYGLQISAEGLEEQREEFLEIFWNGRWSKNQAEMKQHLIITKRDEAWLTERLRG